MELEYIDKIERNFFDLDDSALISDLGYDSSDIGRPIGRVSSRFDDIRSSEDISELIRLKSIIAYMRNYIYHAFSYSYYISQRSLFLSHQRHSFFSRSSNGRSNCIPRSCRFNNNTGRCIGIRTI
jgi:hypothetical protein